MVNALSQEHENTLAQIMELHNDIEQGIASRLSEFEAVWSSGDQERMYQELVFCLLTPQSKARSCWGAVEKMECDGLLHDGTAEEIEVCLRTRSRFHRTKAKRVVKVREQFKDGGEHRIKALLEKHGDPVAMRDWLVGEVNGMGYKEASHFLRNIGLGRDLAILDRHILKNLVLLGVIDEIPKSMSPKRYLEIEARMKEFADGVPIRMDHLDLVLWYKQAGEVFK